MIFFSSSFQGRSKLHFTFVTIQSVLLLLQQQPVTSSTATLPIALTVWGIEGRRLMLFLKTWQAKDMKQLMVFF